MKLVQLISTVKPTQTFPYNLQTTISKCVDTIQSEKRCRLLSVDPDEGEVRVLYGAKKNTNLKLYRWLWGGNNLCLIRFSFTESDDGNTSVTAAISREDGSQTFFDFGGYYEKFIKRLYAKI